MEDEKKPSDWAQQATQAINDLDNLVEDVKGLVKRATELKIRIGDLFRKEKE